MNTKYTEEEDKFILWFKENYKNILIGILFGVTIITSYKFYADSKVNSMHNISLKYEQVMNDYKDNDNKSLLKLSKELSETNPNNIYTNMLNLYAAKIFHETGNYDKSLGKLNLVISNVESDDIISHERFRAAAKVNSATAFVDASGVLEILIRTFGCFYIDIGHSYSNSSNAFSD